MPRLVSFLILLMGFLAEIAGVGATERPLAFPGAEGAGRFAVGGRGGDVYHVTQLGDDGDGSLRRGLESASGPRTIVFDVGGTIALTKKLKFSGSKLTIAGQTAPGDGVTIRDFTFLLEGASDVVIRFVRFRLGDENKPSNTWDTLAINKCRDVILDHVSASWSIDGILDVRDTANFTLQWSILSEALHDSIHPEGKHAMCASLRDLAGPATLHHNLFASSRDRHPTLGTSKPDKPLPPIDFRNNVIFNWSGTSNFGDCPIIARSNYWRPGPETHRDRQPIAVKGTLPDKARGFLSGNVFESREDWTNDNSLAVDFERWKKKRDTKYGFQGSLPDWLLSEMPELDNDPTIPLEFAETALQHVLGLAGAARSRDAVDERVLKDVRERTGKLLNSQHDIGGWPKLSAGKSPLDTDRDGIPDDWEKAHGLDARNADANKRMPNGITAIEHYLDDLAKMDRRILPRG